MWQQEILSEKSGSNRKVEVLKTYDTKLAQEAFSFMDERARLALYQSLDVEEDFDPTDEDALWSELIEAAREDGNILSFFVVNESCGKSLIARYVSPDYPSAEAFAESLIRA